MTVDRRQFLYRLGMGAAALLPVALLAGCRKTEQPTTETTPPASPASEPGSPSATPTTSTTGPVLGQDPATQTGEALVIICPDCKKPNAFPGYSESNKPAEVKCYFCGHVWKP